MLAVFNSCKKEDATPELVNISFWNNETNVGNIRVVISYTNSSGSEINESGWISVTQVPSDCGFTNCANFSVFKGRNVSYTAEALTGEKWNGSMTANSSCTLYELY